jgi:hypothetical protein
MHATSCPVLPSYLLSFSDPEDSKGLFLSDLVATARGSTFCHRDLAIHFHQTPEKGRRERQVLVSRWNDAHEEMR